MATYFIADTHLGHGNILKYCNRPFLNEQERRLLAGHQDFRVSRESIRLMDDTILDQINALVGAEDVLWHLGDFCFGEFEDARRYRERIRCRTVHLVWGNHDKPWLRPLFADCHEQTRITVEGQSVFLNHYPMLSWHGSHKGTWLLFGHVHGRLGKDPLHRAIYERTLMLDVGVDGWGPGAEHTFRPWSMQEIAEYMAAKTPAYRAHRSE
jgi:calcineurin-like phosphoesterase family protein